MKKGEKPQLDSGWWEKNKAKTLLKTGVGEAIRIYEYKLGAFDFDGALEALKTVKTKTAGAAKQCNKLLHGETLECLNKYPAVIAEEEKRLKEKIEEEKNRKPEVEPQKMGPPQVLWWREIGAQFKEKFGSSHPWLKSTSGGRVELWVNNDLQRVMKQSDEGLTTAAFMVQDAEKLFQKCLAEVDKMVKAAPATTDEEKIEAYEEAALAVFKRAAPFFKAIPEKRWKGFIAQKQQYKAYRIKCGFNAALTGLKAIGTGLSIAAAVPTGGASLALAVVGGVSTVADAVKQIRNAAQEAETVLDRLVKNLDKMNSEFLDTRKKALGQAKAVGSTIANTILNFPMFPSLKACEEDCGLASDKTAGLFVRHAKLGGLVSKTMKKVDDFEQALRKAPTKKIGKLQQQVVKVRQTLSKALDACSNLGGRADKCEEIVEQVEDLLKQVKENAGQWLVVFDKVFPIVYNLALSGATAGVGFVDAKNAMETMNTAVGLGNDLLSEAKNQLE